MNMVAFPTSPFFSNFSSVVMLAKEHQKRRKETLATGKAILYVGSANSDWHQLLPCMPHAAQREEKRRLLKLEENSLSDKVMFMNVTSS